MKKKKIIYDVYRDILGLATQYKNNEINVKELEENAMLIAENSTVIQYRTEKVYITGGCRCYERGDEYS